MVDVNAFRGVLYNPGKVSDLKQVVTPPYDVITPEAQEIYYRRHDCNVIRLDLGKEFPDDNPQNNRYTRAAGFFKGWQENRILIQDNRPALYQYEITYSLSHPGQTSPKTLRGFFAIVKLEPISSGRILPHENTFPKVKEDRLHLLRACRANFSPIFALYMDAQNRIQDLLEQGSSKIAPRIDFVHEDQTHHRMWSVDHPDVVQKIQKQLSSEILLIADGHHRYETALAFRQEYPQADHMLMLLVNMKDPGMSLLPIHRVLHGLSADRTERLLKDLSRYFETETAIPNLADLQQRMEKTGQQQTVMGLYSHTGHYQLLRLKPEGLRKAKALLNTPPPSSPLDVDIFDQLVLEDLLELKGGASDRGNHILYIKDPEEGVEKVKRGTAQMAFFLNPVNIQVVQKLAQEGIKMPHKSTYFYPKPLSGLVINALPTSLA
jgi:uncharacterized protein (DUF1015 family)